MSTIGIAGIGRMGAALAERLLELGQSVAVWNRTSGKTEPLRAAGARVAASAAELATMSEAVISVLTDARAISATYQGDRGLLRGDVREKLFIDMSTVRPSAQIELAGEVARTGARFVECPVAGSVGAVRAGQLFAFVGGETENVARAMPLLQVLCRRIEHVGGIGSGASVKLAVNLPMHVYWHALNEALALCAPLQLDPARLIDIFADTPGAPNSLRRRQDQIVAALAGKEPPTVEFDIDSIRKDLAAMMEEARSLGVTSPLTACASALYEHVAREGLGQHGAASLLRRGPKSLT